MLNGSTLINESPEELTIERALEESNFTLNRRCSRAEQQADELRLQLEIITTSSEIKDSTIAGLRRDNAVMAFALGILANTDNLSHAKVAKDALANRVMK
jgi:hypothetical protein